MAIINQPLKESEKKQKWTIYFELMVYTRQDIFNSSVVLKNSSNIDKVWKGFWMLHLGSSPRDQMQSLSIIIENIFLIQPPWHMTNLKIAKLHIPSLIL